MVLFARLASGLLRRFELESEIGLTIGVVIFALHPAQSAAVSWISGSRDLAATTFALGPIGVYFANRRGAAVTSTLLFVAGLLCKPYIAGVPLAIALYVANKAYCLYRGDRFDEVLGLQVNLRDAAVRDGFARNPRAASVFATSVAAAYDARGALIRAFAYVCQAQAVTPEVQQSPRPSKAFVASS